MQWFLVIFYLIICFSLIGVVLMQRGKDSSGDLFGAGASSVLTGQGTTSFLVKLTATLSVLFFVLSFLLGVVINQSAERLRIDDVLKAKDAIVIESAQKAAASQAPITAMPLKANSQSGAQKVPAIAKDLKSEVVNAQAKSTVNNAKKHGKQPNKSVQKRKKAGKVATS